ncbi:MAG: class I SAM-dependent methyltransferase [Betaproteobacteria bacterium]|nr:class I SAM-dependent methyltransferase [Betaproteobacteria bacterium]
MKTSQYAAVALLTLLLAGCACPEKRPLPSAQAAPTAASFATVISAPDRSETDRKTDARRKPADLLAFVDVKPGARILDIGAGGGYTAELLARAAGKQSMVWGQNDQGMMEKFVKTAFDNRATALKDYRLIKHVADFENPVPPGAAPLDLVTIVLIYHDIAYLPVDRSKMLKNLYAAMKPGATLVIVDHSAKTGEGVSVAKTLHRIEEATVRAELEAAGFVLVGESNFQRNADDARNEAFFKLKTPTDQFALKYRKP